MEIGVSRLIITPSICPISDFLVPLIFGQIVRCKHEIVGSGADEMQHTIVTMSKESSLAPLSHVLLKRRCYDSLLTKVSSWFMIFFRTW